MLPAFVHFLTQATSSQAWPSAAPTAARISPRVTSLHEQTCASSGMPGMVRAAGRRQDQVLRVGGQLDAAGDHRPQDAVRRRVADEDPAEEALAVLGHDQLLVDPADGVGEDQLQGPLGGGERVAEGRHVDAEELELRGHVGAGERAGPVEQRVRDHLGHGVAGRDQAVHPAAGRRALADREDVRVGGAALLVDEYAAPLGRGQPGVAGQLVARADAGREHDQVGLDDAVRGLQPDDLLCAGPSADPSPAASPTIALVAAPVCTRTPSFSMWRTSVPPAAASSWTGISRGAISTTCVSSPSWTSAFAASSPSSPPPITTPEVAVRRGRPDRLEVLDGAVDEAAVQLPPGDRRHERCGTGREHERVVRQHPAVGQRDLPGVGVDRLDDGAELQPHPRVVVRPLGQQRQLRRRSRRRRRTSARPGRTPGAAPPPRRRRRTSP